MSNTYDKKSSYDPGQISRMGFDDTLRAHRMVIVNPPKQWTETPEKIAVQESKNTESINNVQAVQIERIEIPYPVKEIEIREVQIPVIVKEVQIIEVEKIVYQDRIVKVEVPVIVKEYEKMELQAQNIVAGNTQIIEKDLPKWLKVVLVAQFLTTIIMLLKK